MAATHWWLNVRMCRCQLLLDVLEQGFGQFICLLFLGDGQVHRKLLSVVENRSTNLLIRRGPRPEVRCCSAGDGWDLSKRRRAKVLTLGHQKGRPGPQILKKLGELPVQWIV